MPAERQPNESPRSEALAALLGHTAASGGVALGPMPAESRPRWADELIRQFNDATTTLMCPHLRDGDTAALWLALVPDLMACLDCTDELVARVEARLGHSLAEEPARCSICGEPGPARGVSLAAGRFLLRGLLCARCEADGPLPQTAGHEAPATSASLERLGLDPVIIDHGLLHETTEREPFDELGWQMLARAGRLTERLVESVGRRNGAVVALDLDQAVVGGLLVRVAKLIHSVFDATQRDSEAHSPLSRCLGETAITLRWLVARSDPAIYRRFRADSFARFRALRDDPTPESDPTADKIRATVLSHLDDELVAAGVSWEDVPAKPNSWGPDVRQRFEALGQGWLYETLFVSHSNYVHPTWHEIRAFHLRSDEVGLHLDPTRAGMTPIAAFVLARLVVEACLDAASVLPNELDGSALREVVDNTVQASHELSVAFSDFIARGGLDPDLSRHLVREQESE